MSTRNAGNAQEETRSTQRPPRPQSKKWPRLLDVLCELPPPLGVVLPELRRGSPTSLRQGYGRPPQRGCRAWGPRWGPRRSAEASAKAEAPPARRRLRSNVGFFYRLFGRRTANIGEGESVFTPARAQGPSVRQLHADARGRDSCRRNRRDADDRPG